MTLQDLYVGKIVHFVGVGNPVRGYHFPAIVVRIADEGINRVVLTIFTDQVERGAASSTRSRTVVDRRMARRWLSCLCLACACNGQ